MRYATVINISAAFILASMTPVLSERFHPETKEKLAKEQIFTYSVIDKFASIDPGISEDVESSSVIRDLFEGLMNQDKNGNLELAVAESYTVNDTKDEYTFKLRSDALWSNGDPVTAHDFVFAWKRVVNPVTASPYAKYMRLMSVENADDIIKGKKPFESLGVSAPDDRTFVVKLEKPLPYFLQMLTHVTTFPVPKKVVQSLGKEWTKPGNMVSNGAYILTEYIISERLVRERNPMYRDNENTIIDKVVALIINDDNIALTRYFAGELDRTAIPTGQYKRLLKKYPLQTVSVPKLCTYYYTFNLSDSGPEFFKDINVRRALSLAIDRKIITENVIGSGQTEAYTFTPPLTAGFSPPDLPVIRQSQAERNAEAKRLLEKSGYNSDNPLKFKMIYNTSESHKKIAIAMSQMWKKTLGVEVTLGNMEWKTFLSERGNQNFELARFAWCGDYNEASTFLDLVTTNSSHNDGKYSNSRVDELMQMSTTADDPLPLYREVEQIIANDVPIIPVYFYTAAFMLKSNVKNWPFENIEQKWYSRNLYKVAQ